MDKNRSDQWLLYFVRGLFALLFGAMMILMPPEAFTGLVIFLGIFVFIDGLISIFFSAPKKGNRRVRRTLLTGAICLMVFLFLFFNSYMVIGGVLLLFTLWSFFSGLREMLQAFNFKGRDGEGWYIISALLVGLIVLLVFVNPFAGDVTLSTAFGAYALLSGVLLLWAGLRLKNKLRRQVGKRRYQHQHGSLHY